MKKKKQIIILVCILMAIIIAAGAFTYYSRSNGFTNNAGEMKNRAEEFYKKGDLSKAIYQLEMYCDRNETDALAAMTLGDWFSEYGDNVQAVKYYNKSMALIAAEDKASIYANGGEVVPDNSGYTIDVTPVVKTTNRMRLVISGENLTPKRVEKGLVDNSTDKLKNTETCKTTGWFYISPKMKKLTMSGDFNTAVWQFQTSDGEYLIQDNKLDYKKLESVRFTNHSIDTVSVPENAFRARVTFFDSEITDSEAKGSEVLITVGDVPDGYTNYVTQVFAIPDLSKGESVSFSDGAWKLKSKIGEKKLDLKAPVLKKGMYCYVIGDLCGKVKIDYNKANSEITIDKTKIYGVRFSNAGTKSACIRTDDAAGMNFDYKVGSNWVQGTGNDFDKAYPWSDMKLCNVSENSNGEKTVVYSDENGFSADGSKGNVMVEIPKFYIRRAVAGNTEEIRISGSKHEGFSVEPVFLDDNGNELDKVYVSAYLGSEENNKIVSKSNSYPVLMLKYDQTLEMAKNNGGGFKEMNYAMVSALQKLFLVETGTIDSSSIFAGDTFKYYFSESDTAKKTGNIIESAKSTNSVKITKNIGTEKISEGSSIVIFDGWDNYSNTKSIKRQVTRVIEGEEELTVEFDGAPVTVTKDKTAISNIPERTGKTSSINYCTGTLEGDEGKMSFKYRNIENLYGSALIMLDDDSYVKDNKLYVKYGYDTVMINDNIVAQKKDLSNYDNVNRAACVRKMTYDSEHPFAMLPSAVGGGASSLSGYGDFWQYSGAPGAETHLCYGGADDNARIAGVFQLRALFMGKRFRLGFCSARIMYK